MDAIGAYGIDEILISTLPGDDVGWLRPRPARAPEIETGLPVSTSWSTSTPRACPFDVTLVLANQTAAATSS
jgi:hypothetical protein